MTVHTLAAANSPIDLNQPGHYLTWSVFDVSVANLIVIAVMVVIFGLALLVPFPHKHLASSIQPSQPLSDDVTDSDANADDSAMWTARVRRRALRLLPPGKLLPDRQPAYVRS